MAKGKGFLNQNRFKTSKLVKHWGGLSASACGQRRRAGPERKGRVTSEVQWKNETKYY